MAIVGSAPSCLDNEPGFIDSHDIVIRINNFKLSPETGFRTDIFYSFFGSSIKKQQKDLKNTTLCMCKCPDSKFIESKWHRDNGREVGVDFRYIYEARKDWWFCDTYIPTTERFLEHFAMLDNHIPTTGFACILDVLDCDTTVYITGFDFFKSKIHNINEHWRPGRKDDPIGHDPRGERRLLKTLLNEKITMDKTLRAICL